VLQKRSRSVIVKERVVYNVSIYSIMFGGIDDGSEADRRANIYFQGISDIISRM
jgi:hypothetical protein